MSVDDMEKAKKYAELLRNKKQLIASSRSLIRRKKNPRARSIADGNVRAIVMAAKSQIAGTLGSGPRGEVCRIMCKAEKAIRKGGIGLEMIVQAIFEFIGYLKENFNNIRLIIPFLWMLREHFEILICKCGLTGECDERGKCISTARA